MHLQENTLLQGGEYRIIRFIDSGGFGCTYEAYQKSLDRRIAIKEFFWHEHCLRDTHTGRVTVATENNKNDFEKLRNKFVNEARTIAKLHHPGIVRVSAVFEENGTAYYVMDYIEGCSLGDLVKDGEALSEVEALRYIRQVAEALQYVHSKNRLHLDIKPSNIMLDNEGHVILIDFGVSKQYDQSTGLNPSTLLGKSRGYSSIEQMGGDVKTFAPATDIYSLGATLYTLLVGNRPPEAAYIIKGIPIAPLQARGVSNTTIRAIQAAMRADKEDRPQSVSEFLALLDGKEDSGETLFDNGETHYNNPGKTDYEEPKKPTPKQKSKPNSDKPFPWPLVALAGIILSVAAVVGLRGCESHSGREAGTPDTTAVAIDSAAVSSATPSKQASGAKPTTEKLIQDALEKQSEKEDRLARLEAENQQMKEKIRQDSLAAVKKAEEERKAAERKAEEERKEKERQEKAAAAEAARKAEEAKKAQSTQVVATRPSNGYINGHEYVDLGLSVKWATCNVGASSASDWGNYYAWGETSTKTEYWESNSTTYKKKLGDISGDSRYDAARRNWGGSWRMPTKAECQELVNNCTWTWTTQGGHSGYKVTSKKNGNSIFLPAAGYRLGSSLDFQGEYGYYWGSTPLESNTEFAYGLYFGSSSHRVDWLNRYRGRTVRPVCD